MTPFASAARTATGNSGDLKNEQHRGVVVVINVSAASGTPSVVFTIQGKCPLSGVYFTLLQSAAITGVGTTVLRVFPGATAAANLVANDMVPQHWRILATHADGDEIVYSCSACLLP